MSEIKVNKISPKQLCTQLTIGDAGDTIIIPAGATITNSGTATGFGPTGAVSWDTTKKTSGFTAVSGTGYFCDTTSSAFTVTLPASPSAGAIVAIADYANTFATNNLTVGRNGSKIGSISANATLSTNGVSITFVYVDATQGWIVTDSGNRSDLPAPQYISATGGTITTCGNYKIHTFTGPGTFTVTCAGNSSGSNSVDYLVVAGGGGGAGAGGGAGGFRESKATGAPWTASPLASSTSLPVSATGYPITVGSGGAAKSAPTNPAPGTSGNNSIFSTITSTGGGGGGGTGGQNALTGGSGGGAGQDSARCGAAGNTPNVSPPQGNPGGLSQPAPGGYGPGAGGGGATAAGSSGSGSGNPSPGGNGGAGATTSISGSPTTYAGGGGGGSNNNGSGTGGTGGPGGGGSGGGPNTSSGTAGTTNSGGGGGGGEYCGSGAAGGSGIVIIRYRYQ